MATEPSLKFGHNPMTPQIEMWPIDKLVAYTRNPRTHSEEQVTQIAASIDAFGFKNPMLVDTMAEIIAGHGGLLTARKLGLADVPVTVLDHATDAQLALNAGWDEELLHLELAAPSLLRSTGNN